MIGALTVWLSGSGGTGKTRSHYRAISGTWIELVEIKRALFASGAAVGLSLSKPVVRLQPGLGGL
ncbi:MAG: hypothetical protein KKC71_10880 [Chloroflexi bacterium]|nr:hypothetical protein [Chloroflexota bacterium]